ncbi:hypothetical protein JCM9140_718 [Halalkalibacter wakoensis JCM 9140]|uniref:DUF92 domain-containing protein n=1 Tax=Halalkalibacter wakoensis JCM 9140 TaxID=1236970 RepID=W4PY43_9BACI|nr:DUF92 domain-containing protein [Halalkalibacter wakoensis]GAE24766.1 hypothetical protein JCM9140_718 [Halalkalibacter wakoensis JCM 9140]
MIILLIIGILLIAYFAYAKKKLTLDGAIAAIVVGILIVFGFGLNGLAVLGLFFFSSTIIGSVKSANDGEVVQKGHQRDAIQVLANGGTAAFVALLYSLYPADFLLFGFIASLAAANSDTWASEIGALSRQRPYHLVKRQRVSVGTSGAITIIGTVAALIGSLVLVGFSQLLWPSISLSVLMLLTMAGFLGNMFDTIIGGIWQVVYRCSNCGIETERVVHCDERTFQIKGVKWVNNDFVNVGCTIFAAVLGMVIGWLVL